MLLQVMTKNNILRKSKVCLFHCLKLLKQTKRMVAGNHMGVLFYINIKKSQLLSIIIFKISFLHVPHSIA